MWMRSLVVTFSSLKIFFCLGSSFCVLSVLQKGSTVKSLADSFGGGVGSAACISQVHAAKMRSATSVRRGGIMSVCDGSGGDPEPLDGTRASADTQEFF